MASQAVPKDSYEFLCNFYAFSMQFLCSFYIVSHAASRRPE